MDSPLDTPMMIALTITAPLLLILWTWLLAITGHWVFTEIRDNCRAHSLVEAKIIDCRWVQARISVYRSSFIATRPVYRLRYEHSGVTYEIEYLVRDEQQVQLDKEAGTFQLYVPLAQPANARAEHAPERIVYGLFLVGALAYTSWLLAPFLLFGRLQ